MLNQTNFDTEGALNEDGKRDLTGKAHDYLIEQLIHHELQPGNLIEPREIADRLGTSVAPVNRALHRLAHEGFVRIIPRKGSFVENSNPKSIIDQMMMREAIECQAARIYCGTSVEENMETLLALAEKIEGTPASYYDHWTKEIEYHTFLVSLTYCSNMIRSFKSSMRLGFFLRLNLFYREATDSANHIKLTKSFVTTDPDEAERIIRQHLRIGKPLLFQELEIVKQKTWKDI